MRACTPRRHYFDPLVFEAEQHTLFEGTWQLAGFATDLASSNDYICADLGSKSVVIQNFEGELRAFHNVCSHRSSRIRCQASGNGPLRCPYHGWSYNRDGAPYSIPNRSKFDASDLSGLELARWQVDTCGSLVFARRSPEGPPLREYLGGAAEHLEAIGVALGEKLSRTVLRVRANWKIVVENTLEGYHADSVHPNTLGRLGPPGMDFAYHEPHSTFAFKPRDEMTRTKQELYDAFRSRPLHSDQYVHHLVFPNTTIAVSYGMTFNINHIRPIGPAETEIVIYVFESKLGDLSAREKALVRAMRPSIVELTNKIFEEDKGACEAVQLGITEATRDAVLSREEMRVFKFQEAYMRRISEVLP